MPRISLIPSTIAFGDRGVEVAQPILQNAMQLAETFTTELPKIRMQKEALAEEKRRYDEGARFRQSEFDYRKSRDEDADFARSFGDVNTLMQPDMVDYSGDGAGDLAVGKGGAIPRLSMGGTRGRAAAASAEEDPASAAARVFAGEDAAYGKARQAAVAKLTTKDRLGKMVTPSDAQIEDYLAKQGVSRPTPPQSVDTTAESPFGSPANYGLGDGGEAGDAAAEQTTGAAAGVPRMVMSDMRRMQALQRLDSLKAADPTGERRRRHGLPDDQQIEQLKMQLMGDKYPGMQDATPSLLPSEVKQAAELATGISDDGAAQPTDFSMAYDEGGPRLGRADDGDGDVDTQPAAPVRMSPPVERAEPVAGGNDLAMHGWNLATGGQVDPRVADQVRSEVEHGSAILANHPDETVRARGVEVQQALRKAIALGDFRLVAKLRNAIGRLGVFESPAPAPVAPQEEVPTMSPDLQRAIIARMGATGP